MSENMWDGNVGRKTLLLPNTDLKRRCFPPGAGLQTGVALKDIHSSLRALQKCNPHLRERETRVALSRPLHFVGRAGRNSYFSWKGKIPHELHGLLSLCLLSGCRRRILKCKQRAFGLGAKYWHCHFVAFMPEMWFLPFYHRAKRIVCLLKQSLLSHLNCFYLNHKLDRKNNF